VRFDFIVAWRFLTEGRVQTLLIVIGIAVGIGVQVFLDSLIRGLQKDLVGRTVGSTAHITATLPDRFPRTLIVPDSASLVSSKIVSADYFDRPIRNPQPVVDQLAREKGLTALTTVVDGAAFIQQGDKSFPVTIRGFELSTADAIYKVYSRITAGNASLAGNAVCIGADLAKELRIGVGSAIRLSVLNGPTDVFTVSGIFDFESQQINLGWVLMSKNRAAALLGFAGGVSAIEIQVGDVFSAELLAESFRKSYPDLKWTSWQQTNANLLAALQSQSSSSLMIQVLVLLAVTLGISSVLAVSAAQKTKQIGILKAIGSQNRSIVNIFLIQGAILGLVGSFAGCIIGYGLIYGFIYGTAKSTGRPLFPIDVQLQTYVISIVIATVAGTIAASIPARRSARLNPIEVIRNA